MATASQIVDALLQEERTTGFGVVLKPNGRYEVRCPECRDFHGDFGTFADAYQHKMCKYCIRKYVARTQKAEETGSLKAFFPKKPGRKNDKRTTRRNR